MEIPSPLTFHIMVNYLPAISMFRWRVQELGKMPMTFSMLPQHFSSIAFYIEQFSNGREVKPLEYFEICKEDNGVALHIWEFEHIPGAVNLKGPLRLSLANEQFDAFVTYIKKVYDSADSGDIFEKKN